MEPLKIEKLIPGGQALATLETGQKVFLWNALPGELATNYEITKKKSSYLEAIATKIENPSDHRIAPKDSCFLSTSPWQIFDYDYELTEKLNLLNEQFCQFNLKTPEIAPVQTDGNDFHYRNKMEYSLYWDKETEKINLAFHKRGSHQKLPIENSNIERPEILAAAQKIVQNLNENHKQARAYQFLLLRANQAGEVSGGLLEKFKPHPTFNNLTDTLLGHEYSYSPNGFFQINPPVYEMALETIKKHIKTKKVLDLYSGVGTIGLSVARDRELTLVECDKSAFAELVKNCSMTEKRVAENALLRQHSQICSTETYIQRKGEPVGNTFSRSAFSYEKRGATSPATAGARSVPRRGISAGSPVLCKPILAKSEDALDFITGQETVIVDPPRAGCATPLLEKLLEKTPPTVIYLSCNPATLARDLAILQTTYKITEITPFNFFPRTPHLETLAILNLPK